MLQRACGCLIERSSVSDAELAARSRLQLLSRPHSSVTTVATELVLLVSAQFERQLVITFAVCKKGQKARSSYSIIHLSSPSSSNLRRVSAFGASSIKHQAESERDFEICLWFFQFFLCWKIQRRVFASLQREREKKQTLWLMGGLILIDLGCAGCNHWWWILTKGSASWVRVQQNVQSSEISWICVNCLPPDCKVLTMLIRISFLRSKDVLAHLDSFKGVFEGLRLWF